MPSKRGTSNGNERGSAEARRRRRRWLLKTFASDVVSVISTCRCYRCGCLLTDDPQHLIPDAGVWVAASTLGLTPGVQFFFEGESAQQHQARL